MRSPESNKMDYRLQHGRNPTCSVIYSTDVQSQENMDVGICRNIRTKHISTRLKLKGKEDCNGYD